MKKIIRYLFGKRKPTMISVATDSTSQADVLNRHMGYKSMTHGETNLVDLSPVNIVKSAKGQPVLRFCPMQRIHVKERIGKGDGGAIPYDVVAMDLKIPKSLSGELTLKNVLLSSNGRIQVIATEKTEWEAVH
jgi:hypothetical protein